MVRFLAELGLRVNTPPAALPANDVPREARIYVIDIGPPDADSYWTKPPPDGMGGTFGTVNVKNIELFYAQFLTRVESMEELRHPDVDNAMFIDWPKVYLKIPAHPWLYPHYDVEGEEIIPFLSAPLNGSDPSALNMRGVYAACRLEPPSVPEKLSEGMSGISLNQEFSISLKNNDGEFDDDFKWDLFNTPVRVKKSVKENPQYEDFVNIRSGYAQNIGVDFAAATVEAQDNITALNMNVCKTISAEMLLAININIANISKDALGKSLPVVYGTKRISLIKIVEGWKYAAAEYISELIEVYTKDGETLPVYFKDILVVLDYSAIVLVRGKYNDNDLLKDIAYSLQDGCLQVTETDSNDKFPSIEYIQTTDGYNVPFKYDRTNGQIRFAEPDKAEITGYTENKIGEIIVDLVTRIEKIAYIGSFWNLEETDHYKEISPGINIAITSGNTKSAIQSMLKSDMAYFIQQHNGKFTIRKWGEQYANHAAPAWNVTQAPKKNHSKGQENYFSSCVINYGKIGEEGKSFLFDSRETEAVDRYRKRLRKEFDTDLAEDAAAAAIAALLAARYLTIKPVITIGFGCDTSGIELLDTVTIGSLYDGITINGRVFSNESHFVVTGIDPAQDILTLEPTDIYDVTGEYPSTEKYEYDFDNRYANTGNNSFEYIVEGGGI